MNALSISTLPHLISIIPLIKRYNGSTFGYINIIVASTTISFIWHQKNERWPTLTILDYAAATIWFFYEFTLARNRRQVLLLNAIILCINQSIAYDKNYATYHSIWHILSALKCAYISNMIANQFEPRKGL